MKVMMHYRYYEQSLFYYLCNKSQIACKKTKELRDHPEFFFAELFIHADKSMLQDIKNIIKSRKFKRDYMVPGKYQDSIDYQNHMIIEYKKIKNKILAS